MSVQVEKRVFTVDEYERMIESGILSEGERVELIRGEVVKMAAKGTPHTACVTILNHLLNARLAQSATIRIQDPVRLDDFSEPEPDVGLVKWRDDFYRNAHPRPGDVFLIIEVADSTLEFDRETKGPLYAESAIGEYWIVDLTTEAVEVYSDPANGSYRNFRRAERGEVLSPERLPNLKLSVDEVCG